MDWLISPSSLNMMQLLLGLTGFAVIVFVFIFGVTLTKKRRFNSKNFYQKQTERVQLGGYKKQALLNKTEQIAYQAILAARGRLALQIFAQVSLGEILTHSHKKHYRDIMSKRVDFLVTDANFIPILAIEIHGSGHYAQHAQARDNIKKLALTNAGIDYLAIITSGRSIYKDVEKACGNYFYKLSNQSGA